MRRTCLVAILLSAILGVPRLACPQDSTASRSRAPLHREIAVTIDDLPGVVYGEKNLPLLQAVNNKLLSALRANRVPAIGFVNERGIYAGGEIDARIGLLRMWLDSGMTLGNHTFSHADFNTTPLPQYEDELIHGEVITRQLMRERGLRKFYFRYPFNHTGPTKGTKDAFEAFLKSRDYVIAPFTIEHEDYIFNKAYAKARQQQSENLAEHVRLAYLQFLDTSFDYFERRSREVLGYEPKQIFLIHANQLNAECIDQMIQKLKARGYTFITLDQALTDNAYQIKDDYVGINGVSWLDRWTVSLGQKMNNWNEPDAPKFVMDLYTAK